MVKKIGGVKSVRGPSRKPVAVKQVGVAKKESNLWLWIVIALIVLGAIAVMWLLA